MNAQIPARSFLANAAARTWASMFGGVFNTNAKHNHYKDFGFPDQVTFTHTYAAYNRNGLARAAVNKTVEKTWQDQPFLLEKERDGSQKGKTAETSLEKDIRQRFSDLRVWARLAEADRRGMVGRYCAVILRLADGQMFDKPVTMTNGGLEKLIEVIPAWEGQITVSEWDEDQSSESYGLPKMYQFTESAVGDSKNTNRTARQFLIHPDRVIVWSADGTLDARSALEPGFNDLVTLEKIIGAGGEGFWKNAKSAPVLEAQDNINIQAMAQAMGVKPDEIADKMSEQVEDWQKGFDQLLMLQGMQAKTLNVTLPSPEHFFLIALQSFAASNSIPLKILAGSQTGERASTEDADEWARTCMSRRANQTVPNIMLFVNRLERFGILPERDWFIDWTDLLDPSPNERLERIERMANVNDKMHATSEWIFTPEEMRAEGGYEPLSDAEKYLDDATDGEVDAASQSQADEVE
ncbi:anti-CBASS protein Acb1 family protein [Martelella limonii]|uniref:anti-CBASS protein Acb1 family protein n=1 Tax=Martelella limonii TaxID=1647649 RepID=UPI001580C60C|nr:anti-CBASS Acb1 family protein [Martelella limonii]